MRLLAIAMTLAMCVLPAAAQGNSCNKTHPTPENPTIILALLGGTIVMWRYADDRSAK